MTVVLLYIIYSPRGKDAHAPIIIRAQTAHTVAGTARATLRKAQPCPMDTGRKETRHGAPGDQIRRRTGQPRQPAQATTSGTARSGPEDPETTPTATQLARSGQLRQRFGGFLTP